jgi:hypothetical protein
MKKSSEYAAFEHTMRELVKVPHSVIKAKLEEEKAEKKRKKARKEKSHDAK